MGKSKLYSFNDEVNTVTGFPEFVQIKCLENMQDQPHSCAGGGCRCSQDSFVVVGKLESFS